MLRDAGHDVAMATEGFGGESDRALLARAFQEGRLNVTEDLDFGELLVRAGFQAAGVVILRLGRLEPRRRAQRLLHVIEVRGGDLVGQIAVILPDSVRARRMPLRDRR